MDRSQEEVYNEQYPEKDFRKTQFSFNASEQRNLGTFAAITRMGKIAEVMANNFVSNEVMKRLNISATQDSGILYDVEAGTVTTYVPKVICQSCGQKRAEFKYKEKAYCQTCVDLETAKDKKPVEAPVEKEEKKKK